MRLTVDPATTRGVRMRDGTTYPVGRDGHVVITDPAHVAEFRRRPPDARGARASDYAVDLASIGPIAAPGRDCPCGWSGWAWSTTCGRCGAAL